MVCRQIHRETAFLPFSLNSLHVFFGELATITNLISADVVARFGNLSVFNDISLLRLKESAYDVNLEALRKFPNWENVLVLNIDGDVSWTWTQGLRKKMAIYAGAAEDANTSWR